MSQVTENDLQRDVIARLTEMGRRQDVLESQRLALQEAGGGGVAPPHPNTVQGIHFPKFNELLAKSETPAKTEDAAGAPAPNLAPPIGGGAGDGKINPNVVDPLQTLALVHVANKSHTKPKAEGPMIRLVGNYNNSEHAKTSSQLLSKEVSDSDTYMVPTKRFVLVCSSAERQTNPRYATDKLARLLKGVQDRRLVRDQEFSKNKTDLLNNKTGANDVKGSDVRGLKQQTDVDNDVRGLKQAPPAPPEGFKNDHENTTSAKLDKISRRLQKIQEKEKEQDAAPVVSASTAATANPTTATATAVPAGETNVAAISSSNLSGASSVSSVSNARYSLEFPKQLERRGQNYAVIAILNDTEFKIKPLTFAEKSRIFANYPHLADGGGNANGAVLSASSATSASASLVANNATTEVEEPGFAVMATFDQENDAKDFCVALAKDPEVENFDLFVVSMYTWIPLSDERLQASKTSVPSRYRNTELDFVMKAHEAEKHNIEAQKTKLDSFKPS